MATAAQIAANRANAQRSTGPRTPQGKVASGRNHLCHGLASSSDTVLPHEDAGAYSALLESLHHEHVPESPTDEILVSELARAHWKLDRIARMEAALLSTPGCAVPGSEVATPHSLAALVDWFRNDCGADQALLKLSRYENTARRAFYRALAELRRLRTERSLAEARETRAAIAADTAAREAAMEQYLALPPGGVRHPDKAYAKWGDPLDHYLRRQHPELYKPKEHNGLPEDQGANSDNNSSNPILPNAVSSTPTLSITPLAPASATVTGTAAAAAANTQNCNSKPMPEPLAKELARHKRRDPDFSPTYDRTQMSKQLQRWFEKHGQ